MKELFESIWNAPKEDILSVLSQIAIVYSIGLVIVIAVMIYLWRNFNQPD